MNHKLKIILKSIFLLNKWKYLLYFLLCLISIILIIILNDSIFIAVVYALIIVIFLELSFRAIYLKLMGKRIPISFEIKTSEIPIEDHPYLPWVYKKNYSPPLFNKVIYENNRQGFMVGGFKTNNLRHVNGYDGGRDVVMPKPNNIIRINCLGDSATCNYVKNNNSYTSWPLKLENLFYNYNNIEVNNCGMGGYNTNEILIKFLIDTIDSEPDIIIFYHAFVNIRGYLTDDFHRDFWHFRKSFPSIYPKLLRISNSIPTLGLWFLKYLVGEFFCYRNIKYDLLKYTNRNANINRIKNSEGLETYERNLETLINVCNGRGIKLILSTYCYFLYDEIKNSKIHIKFKNIVAQENNIIKKLSKKYKVVLVDNDNLIPRDKKYFIDEVHLTSSGMQLIANNFYSKIISESMVNYKNGSTYKM